VTVPVIEIPGRALVALVGISGSGKSTFARRHFAASQVLASDGFRAMVADDENDLAATDDAFEILYAVAGKRLRRGRLTVVDATNLQQHARADVVRVARAHDAPAVAIVLDVPVPECWARSQARTDRRIGRPVLARQHRHLRHSLPLLPFEGFAAVHILSGADEVEVAHLSIKDSS
jgi:predicted kinase